MFKIKNTHKEYYKKKYIYNIAIAIESKNNQKLTSRRYSYTRSTTIRLVN